VRPRTEQRTSIMGQFPNETAGKRLFTVNETAQMLGSSRSLVYRLLRTGELKATRIGARKRIPETEIARIIEISFN
jgi:excisionase family DNA binding protein